MSRISILTVTSVAVLGGVALPSAVIAEGVNLPTTCSEVADAAIDDGLTLLHNMMYIQAEAAFSRAAEADLDCAVAQWGIAMSNFHPLWPGKPSPEEAPSNLAVAARYICRPSIFQVLQETQPGKGGEIQLTDAFRQVLAGGGRIIGVKLRPGEKRYDVGNFESYFQAFLECALADKEYGDALRASLGKLL